MSVLVPSPWQHAEFMSIEVPQIGKLHPYLWTVLFFPPFFPFWAASQAVGSSFTWEPTRGKAAWSLLLFCCQRCFPLELLTRQVRGNHKGSWLSLDENEHSKAPQKGVKKILMTFLNSSMLLIEHTYKGTITKGKRWGFLVPHQRMWNQGSCHTLGPL